MLNHQTLSLSPFERALLVENPERTRRTLIPKITALLTAILFSLVYVPIAQTAEGPLGADSVLTVLNQDRAKYGLPVLAVNAELEAAAVAKAKDILEHDYFAHTSPAGVEPWDFIKATGFRYALAGENLAINYTSAYDLQNDFLASPAHRENLLSPMFSNIGIAVITGNYRGQNAIITVQMFASPNDQANLAVSGQ